MGEDLFERVRHPEQACPLLGMALWLLGQERIVVAMLPTHIDSIQFNSRKKKRKESKSSQLSLFPWAKIWLCLYRHSSHFACDYDLESFIFPPLSLSFLLFSSPINTVSISPVS